MDSNSATSSVFKQSYFHTMTQLPSTEEQILAAHAGLIRRVVDVVHHPERAPAVEPVLKASLENGWVQLVGAVREILAGRRDEGLLAPLDQEDRTIVKAILRGLQDPSTLPDPQAASDPTLAAPGLAAMVHAAAHGDTGALQAVANLAEQMQGIGGDMARLASVIRPLINGERDPERLTRGMGPQGEGLVLAILEELGRLTLQ